MKRTLWKMLVVNSVALLAGCAARSVVAPPQEPPAALSAPLLNDLVPRQTPAAGDEEIWIIEKPQAVVSGGGTDTVPRPNIGGAMLFNLRGDRLMPLPVEKTEVRADVRGAVASVDVRQRFANTSGEAGEIAWAFPLPQNGAVNEFVMTIGSRHIRGIVRERGEAEQFFREARGQGLLVSLMVQRSPNVFVHRVGNIEAGRAVEIEIRYLHTLWYRDGWFEFAFPMVDGAMAAGKVAMPQRSGRDLTVSVHLDAGAELGRVESPSHTVAVRLFGKTAADVSLEPAERIANCDFILRYRLAGDEMNGSLFTERDGDGGVFAFLLVPPAPAAGIARDATGSSVRRTSIAELNIDWNGANVAEVFPRPALDLFPGHAVLFIGRYHGSPPHAFVIRGKIANEPRTWPISAGAAAALPGRSPLACLWARRKIADLALDAKANPNPRLAEQIQQIALEYGLVTRYTSFVSVDAMSEARDVTAASGGK